MVRRHVRLDWNLRNASERRGYFLLIFLPSVVPGLEGKHRREFRTAPRLGRKLLTPRTPPKKVPNSRNLSDGMHDVSKYNKFHKELIKIRDYFRLDFLWPASEGPGL